MAVRIFSLTAIVFFEFHLGFKTAPPAILSGWRLYRILCYRFS